MDFGAPASTSALFPVSSHSPPPSRRSLQLHTLHKAGFHARDALSAYAERSPSLWGPQPPRRFDHVSRRNNVAYLAGRS